MFKLNLVCDWAHQVPQLFWIELGLQEAGAKLKVLDTCAVVRLYAQA